MDCFDLKPCRIKGKYKHFDVNILAKLGIEMINKPFYKMYTYLT